MFLIPTQVIKHYAYSNYSPCDEVFFLQSLLLHQDLGTKNTHRNNGEQITRLKHHHDREVCKVNSLCEGEGANHDQHRTCDEIFGRHLGLLFIVPV